MKENKYPDCFPDNFETDILPKEAGNDEKDVYRIIKSGIIDKQGFLSTYEEIKKGLIPDKIKKGRISLNDPKLYSTSCIVEMSEAEYALDLFMRHNPPAIISKGKTKAVCGPNQLTSEREKNVKTTHVDWWIYKHANPQLYFKKVD